MFNLTRLVGALLMLVASGALNWLTGPDQFRLDPGRVSVEGLQYTPAEQAAAIIDPQLAGQPNVLRVRTQAIERALEALPAVAQADAVVTLPNALAIRVTERQPVMAWQVAQTSLLIDASGYVISEAPEAVELPRVIDRRSAAAAPQIGARLDSIDLAAALRLAALTPELLGSGATSLGVEVEDEDGWLVHAEPVGWRAAFGHYTTNLRPTTLINQQVQCLRSLLEGNEEQLEVIYLTPSEDRCGTFRVRPTPRARIFQNVLAREGPSE